MKHPHMVMVWAFYVIGVILHILMAAATTVSDKQNSITTYKQYFRTYAVAMAARFFILICAFPFVWDNPTTFDIEGSLHTTGAQIGASGVIGFFCDSFVGTALSVVGITQKLPQLPGEPTPPTPTK